MTVIGVLPVSGDRVLQGT